MAKVGGGVNPIHLSDTAHPFEISGKNGGRSTVKFCRTRGVGPQPGGDGDKISANAQMKKKRPLNGSGEAK